MGLSALDAKTGKPVWRAEAFQPAQATDIMFDGSAVYAVGFEGKLWAIDAATGTLRWEHVNTPGGKHGGCLSTPSPPTASSSTAYSGGSDWTTGKQLGLVWGLDPATGREVWRLTVACPGNTVAGEGVVAIALSS